MKKKILIIIIIVVVILTVILLPIILKNKKSDQVEDEYTITSFDGIFKIDRKNCAKLDKENVQKIEDKLFLINHNIVNTFKDAKEELTTKDYQMTVWFKKMKLDKEKSCTSAEFEQIIKDTYNVEFKEHQSLENTMEYLRRRV